VTGLNSTGGQFVECGGDFAHGAPEPVDGDNDELVALAQVSHALGPTRTIATGATGRRIRKDPIGDDARRGDGVVLLIDRLLPGGHPEVRGDGHVHMEPPRSDNSSGVTLLRSRTCL